MNGDMFIFRLFAPAVVVTAFFICSPSADAQHRVSERDDFRNTAYVQTDDDELSKHFRLAVAAIDAGDDAEAVANLVRALRRGGDALVPFGERTYLTGRNAVFRKLGVLRQEAFGLYLETVAEESERFMTRALSRRNGVMLREGAARFPFTPASYDALRMLGDLASERGDDFEAARSYERYLDQAEQAPAGKPGQPERDAVRLGLYIALLGLGRLDAAEGVAPEGPVLVGGREVDVANLAEEAARPSDDRRAAEGGWPTRGGGRSRDRLTTFDCESLKLIWQHSLVRDAERESSAYGGPRSLREKRRLDARRVASSVYPVVWGGQVFLFNEHALHAFDLETGERIFGPLLWDWSLLFGDEEPDLDSVSYAGTVADDILYVVLNRRSQSRGSRWSDHAGILLALDLGREGACVWMQCAPRDRTVGERTDGEDGPRPETGPFPGRTAFTGAPVVVGDRVFLIGTHHTPTQAESWLFCFGSGDGTLLFKRFLCSGAEVRRFGATSDLITPSARDRIELGAPLVERSGILYCLTNLGVAGAVDAVTGEILWLFKYNRIFTQDPDTYDPAYFIDNGGWEDSLPLFGADRFIFAPSDSRFLYTLAPQPDGDGFIVLDDPVDKNRFVSFIGYMASGKNLPTGAEGRELFYFTAREGGRNYIAATERSGALVWESDFFETEDRITGHPLLTQEAIFIPTLRYIYRVDLDAHGLITHSFAAPTRSGTPGDDGIFERSNEPLFGNIITTGDRLISVSDKQILVFSP